MIRHIVFFKTKPGVSQAERDNLINDLRGLKEKISQIIELEVEVDIGRKENSYDFALHSVFDTMASLHLYSTHDEHVKIVNRIKRLCQATVKVDFEF